MASSSQDTGTAAASSAGAASSASSGQPRAPLDAPTGFRTHTCGELRMDDVGKHVTLAGWVQTGRDLNHFAFIDLRDRHGITQCVFLNTDTSSAEEKARYEEAKRIGREWVVQVKGEVVERSNKNKQRATGDVEVVCHGLTVLNSSHTPPFLIQDPSDALEDLRMQYRYLDIRRPSIAQALLLRNAVTRIVRNHLNDRGFVEVETPVLIKSTPEGARDFVVPSRMNPGSFYALPQSPQTFKQLLMVAGMDRYFQIVKCFRDEELRADRQPEFTQIDCELSFVTQDDVLRTFESMIRALFKETKGVDLPPFPRMTWQEAMDQYGIDKPDLRFGMKLHELTDVVKGKNFKVFDEAEYVVGISCPKAGTWSNAQVKALDKLAASDSIGAKGLVWVKVKSLKEGALEFDSSAKKFFEAADFAQWAAACEAQEGDLICVFAGPRLKTQTAMGKMRNAMAEQLGLRTGPFAALWVVDFPLLEWDEDDERFVAMHHPFTSCKPEDAPMMDTAPGSVRANAYDMVINGVEVGGGSIRIHDREMQMKTFKLLGFTPEEAQRQFGFLLGAFSFGAPPHGGIAFGLDRLCTIIGGGTTIRDYIAFPKNNQGRDVMIESPSEIATEQLEELKIYTEKLLREKGLLKKEAAAAPATAS